MELCKGSSKREALLDNGYEDVNSHSDPILRANRIFRSTEERLNAEVLLNPLEKEFDSPAKLIKRCNSFCGEREVVSEKCQSLFGFRITVDDTPKFIWVIIARCYPERVLYSTFQKSLPHFISAKTFEKYYRFANHVCRSLQKEYYAKFFLLFQDGRVSYSWFEGNLQYHASFLAE